MNERNVREDLDSLFQLDPPRLLIGGVDCSRRVLRFFSTGMLRRSRGSGASARADLSSMLRTPVSGTAGETKETARTADGKRPRVAILLVNGFDKRAQQHADEAARYPWIGLCLRQIEKHSKGWDLEVFVFDNSHLKQHRSLMRQYPYVRVRPRNGVAVMGRWLAAFGRFARRIPVRHVGRVLLERTHPKALDYLARKVPADFDYIVTLDTDSFPVRDDWLDVLVSACERGAVLSGVYRNEMAPTVHPFIHVSGLCVRRRDLRDLNVSFGRKMRFGVGRNQDVGQKITYEFIRLGREIAPLERSNRVNFHVVIGGIYGDVIYHHGAGSREANFRTNTDFDTNELVRTTLRDAVFEDSDHLIAVLRGQAPNDLGLVPLSQ
jgi:hypothetical protein